MRCYGRVMSRQYVSSSSNCPRWQMQCDLRWKARASSARQAPSMLISWSSSSSPEDIKRPFLRASPFHSSTPRVPQIPQLCAPSPSSMDPADGGRKRRRLSLGSSDGSRPRADAASPATDNSSRKMTFRLRNIPNGKTDDDVRAFLSAECTDIERAIDIQLSLYPSTNGRHQVGILTLTGPEDFLKLFSADDYGNPQRYVAWDDTDVSIDRHFHGLTPLNTSESPKAE